MFINLRFRKCFQSTTRRLLNSFNARLIADCTRFKIGPSGRPNVSSLRNFLGFWNWPVRKGFGNGQKPVFIKVMCLLWGIFYALKLIPFVQATSSGTIQILPLSSFVYCLQWHFELSLFFQFRALPYIIRETDSGCSATSAALRSKDTLQSFQPFPVDRSLELEDVIIHCVDTSMHSPSRFSWTVEHLSSRCLSVCLEWK